MPPRLRYLNTVRHSTKLNVSSSKAALSTTARVLAGPNRPSAPNDLLSSTDHPRSRPALAPIPSSSRSPNHRRGAAIPERNAPGNNSANTRIQSLVQRASVRDGGGGNVSSNTIEELKRMKLATDLSRQIYRRWKVGDVYAPHDLSAAEMQKWKKRTRPESDAFDVLDMNPLDEYKNFSIMSEYMTPMGRIIGSAETGLRGVNQRKIAKAIRRSIGLGLMPSVYRHPEILHKLNAKLRLSMGKMR